MSKKKIAILGGGMAGCTAAYWLSHTEALRARYEVTLYQLGWRLGGKGASGRDQALAHRSLEHGPHGWFGFYQRAFKTLRGCYQATGTGNGPWKTWDDSFLPADEVVMCDQLDDRWDLWKIRFDPQDLGEPGDADLDDDPVTPSESIRRITEFIIANTRHFGTRIDVFESPPEDLLERSPSWRSRRDKPDPDPRGLWLDIFADQLDAARPALDGHLPISTEPMLDALDHYRHSIPEIVEPAIEASRTLRNRADPESVREDLWRQDETRRIGVLLDFLTTVMYGFLRDKLWIRGFDHINPFDFQNWLKQRGGTYCTITENGFLRSLYDIAFSYEQGDATRTEGARLAAGVAVQTVMKAMFGYSRHSRYIMKAGMGEVVFTPVYEALKKNGVEIQFFHRVESLHPDPAGSLIDRVVLRRQARIREGDYEPLIGVPLPDGSLLRCWPEEPLADQLEYTDQTDPGARLRLDSFWSTASVGPPRILKRRTSSDPAEDPDAFDQVILAMPPAAQQHLAGELMDKDPRYRRMVEHLSRTSVRTANCQLWFNDDDVVLGWDRFDEFHEEAAILGYEPVFNTLLDSSIVLDTETWTDPKPGSLYYLCGPYPDDPDQDLTDPAYPETQTRATAQVAHDWLTQHASFWPSATLADDPDRLNPAALYGPDLPLKDALDHQYIRCNINPWDLYVQSMPGTIADRLPANGTRFTNLILAGDWTRNGIDIGCIESAARSGYYAALCAQGLPFPLSSRRGCLGWLAALPATLRLGWHLLLSKLSHLGGSRS